jgi:hypothetical protein
VVNNDIRIRIRAYPIRVHPYKVPRWPHRPADAAAPERRCVRYSTRLLMQNNFRIARDLQCRLLLQMLQARQQSNHRRVLKTPPSNFLYSALPLNLCTLRWPMYDQAHTAVYSVSVIFTCFICSFRAYHSYIFLSIMQ